MASGILSLSQGFLQGQILWESVSNGSGANTSTVTASMQVRKDAYAATTGTFSGTFTVGGVTESWSKYLSLANEWQTVKTITATVVHNTDGTGACYLYGKAKGPSGTTLANETASGSGTVTLDTIPRYAALVTAPDFNDEENPVITYTNPAGSAITSLQACISLTGSSADIAYREIPKDGTSYTFSLTTAERNVLRSATTTGNTRSVVFLLRSTLGGVTETSSLPRTLSIANAAPVLSPSVADTRSESIALTGNSGKLIRLISYPKVTFNASALKGASIVSRSVTCGSQSLTGDGTFYGVESGSFHFTVTDSRGNTTTEPVSVPFVDYSSVTCAIGNNIPDAAGSFTLTASGSWFNGSFGASSNTLTVLYRYKAYGGSYGSWASMSVSKSGNAYTASASLTGLDYKTTYVFQVYVYDRLSTSTAERNIKAEPVFDWGKEDFRFRVPITYADGTSCTSPAPSSYIQEAVTATASDPVDQIIQRVYGAMSQNARRMVDVNVNDSDPVLLWGHWHFIFSKTNANYGWLVAESYYTDTVRRVSRTLYGGVWQPWEWETPPLETGKEYRTTERYQGKPVYCKLLSLGTIADGNTVSTGLTDGTILRHHGTTGYYAIPYGGSSGTTWIRLDVTREQIKIACGADFVGSTAEAVIWYVK